MGQSQAARFSLRRSGSTWSANSVTCQADFKGIVDPIQSHGVKTASTYDLSDEVTNRSSNASMTSNTSDLPALLNDQHVLESEKAESGLITLLSVSELLCDLSMEVDSKFRITPAHGRIDKFFQSEVEGRSVLDLVPQADRHEVENALRTISLTRARLLRTVLLCDHGIGTIEAKLLLMRHHDSSNAPLYVIGVRTDQMQGLTTSVRSNYESETSETGAFALPSASIAPGFITHEPPIGFQRTNNKHGTLESATPKRRTSQRRTSRISNASSQQTCQTYAQSESASYLQNVAIVPTSGDSSPLGKRRNSNRSYDSGGVFSEVSFNISDAPSVTSRNSLAYTASTISSALGLRALRWSRRTPSIPSQRGTPRHMSLKSGFSIASRTRSKQFRPVDVEIQTETNLQDEKGTQTDSSHVPLTKHLQRPPPKPGGLRSSKRSSHSSVQGKERERRPSITSRQSSCKSDVPSNKTPGQQAHLRMSTASSGVSAESTGPTGGRRIYRANTDTKGRRASECSSSSADLVIRHFEATPINTVMFFIDTMTERINVHDTGFSCCFWHATVRTIATATHTLSEQGCKGSYWLPCSGWQCVECFALNDVDEDECNVCCGDRSPLREPRVHLTSISSPSEVSD